MAQARKKISEMTEEEQEEARAKRREYRQRRRANMTDEEWEKEQAKVREYQRKRRANMSEEEKERMREYYRPRRANMSEEEKEKIRKQKREYARKKRAEGKGEAKTKTKDPSPNVEKLAKEYEKEIKLLKTKIGGKDARIQCLSGKITRMKEKYQRKRTEEMQQRELLVNGAEDIIAALHAECKKNKWLCIPVWITERCGIPQYLVVRRRFMLDKSGRTHPTSAGVTVVGIGLHGIGDIPVALQPYMHMLLEKGPDTAMIYRLEDVYNRTKSWEKGVLVED